MKTQKVECKRDAENLYTKLIKLEDATLTFVREEVPGRFKKTRNSKTLALMYLNVIFCYNLCFCLLKNPEKIHLTGWLGSKRFVWRYYLNLFWCFQTYYYTEIFRWSMSLAFSERSRQIYDKISKSTLWWLCDPVMQKDWPHVNRLRKRFKFLSEFMNNSEFDHDTIKFIISHYIDGIDHKLVNDCYQFKEYIQLRIEHKRKKFFRLFVSNA